MASNFPVYGVEYVFYVALQSQSASATYQANPTLAAGDVTVSKDGGADANLTTLPVATPASGKRLKVTVSATEMQADDVSILFSDAAGAEWADLHIDLQPIRIPYSTVDNATVTPTTTVFDTDLTEATDDHFNDLYVYFLTGSNSGLSRKISDYDGTVDVGKITVATALPDAPADGDKFIILGRSE